MLLFSTASIDLSFELHSRAEWERAEWPFAAAAEPNRAAARQGRPSVPNCAPSPPPLPTSVAHNQQQAEQRPSDLDWVRMVGGGGGGGGGGGRRRADYFIQQQNNDREWGEEGGLRRWGVSLFSSSHYFSSVF